ncbi:hypothetical protein CCAX7_36220 [Capsulimonas corticalis]|uniref:Uncharacterized protein n=1 Tax=Capsulimonas corticalis TaxID=2219043 RepID=A0A402D704_9BACT|nr:hypothetical protein [Capsulimonas corticalis]BDI31571.1 hypothetical protein CCAX7_36220 [Capsulimonas corticalis]
MKRSGAYTTLPARTVTPAAFMRMIEQTFAEALESAPDDANLHRLQTTVIALRAAGRPGAADDEMRKWYAKRQT